MKKLLSISFIFSILFSLGIQAYEQKAVTDNIEGIYRVKKEHDGYIASGNCPITIEIKKVKGAYIYSMTISDEKYDGNVRLDKEIEQGKEILYITFEGFKWEANCGPVGDDDELPPSVDTYGLDGIWSDGTIIIQNTGNSMNYYVKVGGCDMKYIVLEREKIIKENYETHFYFTDSYIAAHSE